MKTNIPTDLELVIFDLDGTLYDMTGISRRLAFTFFFRLRWLLASRKARAGLGDRDFGDREAYFEALGESMAGRLGKSPERCLKWYRMNFHRGFVRVLRRYRPRTGLEELLNQLKERGTTLALVSAYSAIEERIEALGLDSGFFSIIESCEDVGALKPSPKSFRDVIERCGAAPERTLAIGDQDSKDGEAARRAGVGYVDIRDVLG